MKKISICIGTYNEEKNVEATYTSLTDVFSKLSKYDYEIIFSDNASVDKTQEILEKICKMDKHVKAIFNIGNFGPARSGRNCCNNASGDAIIIMPCDLQEPPEMIPRFIEEWEHGNLVVWAQKVSSKENIVKMSLRKLYYNIISSFSDVKLIKNTTGFGIMDISVYREIYKTEDMQTPMRYLVPDLRFPVKLIPYTQNKRYAGKSSYNLRRYLDFSIMSLVTTSYMPIRVITMLGFLGLGLFVCAFIVMWIIMLVSNSFNYGILTILAIFLGVSILQFCIGIVGEYVYLVLNKITKRPIVVEKRRLNFD